MYILFQNIFYILFSRHILKELNRNSIKNFTKSSPNDLNKSSHLFQSKGPVYLTTHTRLPVHIVDTNQVTSYWSEYATFLGPGAPHSDSHSIPSMKPIDIEPIQPVDLEASVADIVLSGAGKVQPF